MLQSNPQLELAFEYVRSTNKNIFLTGKAGTGKTTFLHQIKKLEKGEWICGMSKSKTGIH